MNRLNRPGNEIEAERVKRGEEQLGWKRGGEKRREREEERMKTKDVSIGRFRADQSDKLSRK